MAELTISEEIKSTVEKVVKGFQENGGIEEVYLVACGGSLFELNTLEYLLKCEAESFYCTSISANEFFHATPARVGKNALVITMSLSGSTGETVAAEKKARELGAVVLAIAGKEECALNENADYHIVFSNEAGEGEIDYERSNIAIALRIGFELLGQIDGFKYYDNAARAFQVIDRSLHSVVKKVQRRARAFAQEHKNDTFIYTVGSGSSYGLARAMSVCFFTEMEWINSSAIHAGEMFHGPFECVNFDTPYLVLMSEGRNRPLDQRALNFVKDQSGRVTIIDARELGVSIIDPEVEEHFSGLYNWIACIEYAKQLAFEKNHPLFERRYMGVVKY